MKRPSRVGRNQVCPCGSGRKFKHCCQTKARGLNRVAPMFLLTLIVVFVVAILFGIGSVTSTPEPRSGDRVWSEEHGHWHEVP